MSAPPEEPFPDPTDDDGSASPLGFNWYHHALAVAYSVSAAVSAVSMPPARLAGYFVASLVGAYVVVAVLTLCWRFAWAQLG